MTKIKLCGLSRICDIEFVNELKPEYIGFVFSQKSKRYVSPEKAAKLKQLLDNDIQAVGVFVNENPKTIAEFLNNDIIEIAQLHGDEDKNYIKQLRQLTDRPIIKAFCIKTASDIAVVKNSIADYVLLDSGAGTGMTFNCQLIQNIKRPYFLAGGLSPNNIEDAIKNLHPFAVDVSSGIETNGLKDKIKMSAFVAGIRKEDKL